MLNWRTGDDLDPDAEISTGFTVNAGAGQERPYVSPLGPSALHGPHLQSIMYKHAHHRMPPLPLTLGVWGSDNAVATTWPSVVNSASAWWPLGSPPPIGTTFHVCLRHYDSGTFNASLQIYEGPALAVNSWTVFTTPSTLLPLFGER